MEVPRVHGIGESWTLADLGDGEKSGAGHTRGQTTWNTGCKMIPTWQGISVLLGLLGNVWYQIPSDTEVHFQWLGYYWCQWLGYYWCLEDKVVGLPWMLSSTLAGRVKAHTWHSENTSECALHQQEEMERAAYCVALVRATGQTGLAEG